MNVNARRVNQKILNMFSKQVGDEDLYITHTLQEADQSIDEIIEKRYPLVMCGGGDGTVMRILEQMHQKVEARNRSGGSYKLPKFCILRLGTGNAIAGLLDVPDTVKPVSTIQQLPENDLTFKRFNIIEAEGRMFNFGGFGVDALILNDYIDIKDKFSKRILWKIMNTIVGYVAAAFLKSIPKIFFHGFKLNVRIINESDLPVYKPSHAAIEETDLKKGDIIYEGPVDAVVFGTTSDFGYKIKIMPFAMSKSGYFHLRLANTGVMKIILNLRSLWLGKWEHPDIHDFLVKDVKIEIDQEAPLELCGDAKGYCSELNLKISDFTPEILDFSGLTQIPG